MTPDDALTRTRRSLHAVAELVLAGPQYAASRELRLAVRGRGFGTVAGPDLLVDGTSVRGPGGSVRIGGHSPRSLGDALGVEARAPAIEYADGSGVALDETLEIDLHAAAVIVDAFAAGAAVLTEFGDDAEPPLWPEHFDVGIAVGEINYGLSPGDGAVPVPYAYVGPWSPLPSDDFWNVSFGAARPYADLGCAAAVVAFFREGQARAARL